MNGYPKTAINGCLRAQVRKLYNEENRNQAVHIDKKFITIPYFNQSSNSYRRHLKKYNINVVFSLHNINNKNFSNMKDKINKLETSNVVYNIQCGGCDKFYIGQTTQKLRLRFSQHRSDVRLKPNSTALTVHANAEGHGFLCSDTKIVDRETKIILKNDWCLRCCTFRLRSQYASTIIQRQPQIRYRRIARCLQNSIQLTFKNSNVHR